MYSFSTLVITGLVCLVAGAGIGALVLQIFRSTILERSLEKQLHEAENSLQGYQRDVTEHFAKTSQLVNNLTDAYREVHQHFANGALKLATPAISRQILDSANASLGNSTKTFIDEPHIQPPRDWAPKKAGNKGVLSEDYGLHDDHQDGAVHIVRPTESADDYNFDDQENSR